MLRNEFSQGYLSASNDSNKKYNSKDIRVVVDQEWSNIPEQRWQFIDNTLRNDEGYCLTVRRGTLMGLISSIFSKRYCRPGSRSQMWIRHGLQIVRLFDQHDDRSSSMNCVGVDVIRDASFGLLFRPVLGECSTNPRYLWYHWEANCEDDMVVDGVHGKRKGRSLRNELSRRFLGAQDDEVKHGPWTNLPGQRWRFVDGQLMNDDGVCLIIGDDNRSLLIQKDCAEAKKLSIHNNWEYNEKRQIVSHDGGRGYCLTTNEFFNGMKDGMTGNIVRAMSSVIIYSFNFVATLVNVDIGRSSLNDVSVGLGEVVYINHCKEVPEQRWWLL